VTTTVLPVNSAGVVDQSHSMPLSSDVLTLVVSVSTVLRLLDPLCVISTFNLNLNGAESLSAGGDGWR